MNGVPEGTLVTLTLEKCSQNVSVEEAMELGRVAPGLGEALRMYAVKVIVEKDDTLEAVSALLARAKKESAAEAQSAAEEEWPETVG